jgi:hypothetical protein
MNKLTNIFLSAVVVTTSIVATTRGAQASYVPTEVSRGYLTELSQGTHTTDGENCFITPASEVSLIGLEGLGLFAIDNNGCTVSL